MCKVCPQFRWKYIVWRGEDIHGISLEKPHFSHIHRSEIGFVVQGSFAYYLQGDDAKGDGESM